jgi:class 3 adenylate cyclase
MSEQRRLAAIVSADVAGYSRLMGQDESGTLAALKSLRQEVVDPAISSHGGRIVKTTGDGLLLEFPSAWLLTARCLLGHPVISGEQACRTHQLVTGCRPVPMSLGGLGRNLNQWLEDTAALKTVGLAQPLPFHSAKNVLSPAPARII